ncbi:SCO6880 family protein [Streptomyces diastaticus]|uniref:SCO6880 family protein n=1 Tax=Streptomyces diastaticus TaxID=1956 RepID=UPI003D174CFB
MAASEPEVQQRTYGNWRRPNTAGLGNLGLAPTLMVIGGLVLVVLATLISVAAAALMAVLVLLLVAPLAIKDRYGRTLLVRLTGAWAGRRARSSGTALYRSGPLGRTAHGAAQLPGLAARSTLSEAADSYGRPFGLISYPTGHHVVVLACEADGASLVEQSQVDTWVAYWGRWLGDLGTEPGLVGCSVTVETAPDTGLRLRREIEAHTADDAPQLAKQMLAEVLEDYPAGSAQITTRIALTYSSAPRPGHPRRTVEEMAVDLGLRLPGLTESLSMTGAGVAVPLSAERIAEAARVAYDPAVAPLVEEVRGRDESTGITWETAGPLSAEDRRDHYIHDSAVSVTWCMAEAPRGEVLSSVLTGLLAPHPDVARKRVTLLYRPHDPATAARQVEADRKIALFRVQQGPRARARHDLELRAAEQSATEEAAGAGLVRFSLLVTATVADVEDLPRARAAVDNLAGPARIVLRPVWDSQAAAFAAALPIGLVLPDHLALPASIRDNL